MSSRPPWFERAPMVALMFIMVAWVSYLPSLWNEYAYDGSMLLDRLRLPTPADISIIGDAANYGTRTGVMSWRPIGTLTMLLADIGLFGHRAALSQALNITLHAANPFLLWLLVRGLGKETDLVVPLVAGLLFVVHPLASEVVLCTGFRTDAQALFFALGAACVVAYYGDGEYKFPFGAAAALVLLAMGSKEVGIVAVPVIILICWERMGITRNFGLAVGYPLIAVGVFLFKWKQFQYSGYPSEFLGNSGRLVGVGNFLAAFSEIYLPGLFMPGSLRIDHGFEPVTSIFTMRVLLGTVVVTAGIAFLAWRCRTSSMARLGSVLLVGGFLPVSQLIAIPDPIAERFAYVPLAGFCIIVAEGFAAWLARTANLKLPVAIALVVLLALSARTFTRCFDWRNDVQLNIANWEAERDPDQHAMEALGTLYLTRGRSNSEAFQGDFRQAYSISQDLTKKYPASVQGWRVLALASNELGQKDEALVAARKAKELSPGDTSLDVFIAKLTAKP